MDPELEAVIAALPPEFADPAASFVDPPALRVRLVELGKAMEAAGLAPVQDPRVSRRDLLVAGVDGEPDVPVRVYEPEGRPPGGPVIMHMHGGAFVIGNLDQDNPSCERLALASGRPVVSVQYRLAPEHPYPAGLNDCFTVYRWLTEGRSDLVIDAGRIVVTGVSAGGGLAAAVALMARDREAVLPMYQLLLYPVLDDRMVTYSMRTLLDQPIWNGRSSVHMWHHYLGKTPDGDTAAYAAPARATDLTGLPPTAIATAEFDPLRDEAIEYALRLMQAGVPTELHVVAGAVHAFDGVAADSRLARRIRENRFAALATVLARTPEESVAEPGERWLDPDVASMVPFLPIGDDQTDLATGRKLLEEMLAVGPEPLPGEETLEITHRTIPGPDGAPDVPVIIYRPRTSTGPVACIVDYHGGAFTYGSAMMDHPANVRIASQLGVVIVSVDYRLAPESPFPAGLDDCYAGLVWVRDNAAELGIDPTRVAVMGGSAGGALAAAVALMARDRGGPPICFQALQIPVTDDHLDTWSSRTFVDTPMFNRPGAVVMWERYLGAGYQDRETSAYAAPARATDLSRLPPAYVATMELDPLRDEGIGYARRLLEAGVPVELHSYPGTFHGSGMAAHAAVSQRAMQEMIEVLGRALEARA